MWFRLSNVGTSGSGNGNSGVDGETSAEAGPILANMKPLVKCKAVNKHQTSSFSPASSSPSSETSRFEKFRRASFRRKSSTTQTSNIRKRSKSPHSILQMDNKIIVEQELCKSENQKSLAGTAPTDKRCGRNKKLKDKKRIKDETNDENHKETTTTGNGNTNISINTDEQLKIFKNEVNIAVGAQQSVNDKEFSLKLTGSSKSKTLPKRSKTIKTEPPKRKFHKRFAVNPAKRQNSYDEGVSSSGKFMQRTEDDNENEFKYITDNEDNDDDDDHIEDADDVKINRYNCGDKKEKILLIDRKYTHNRIEMSSCKSKIADLENRVNIKRSRSGRKKASSSIAATSNQNDNFKHSYKGNRNGGVGKPKQNSRVSTNLNLQALIKYIMNNRNFLSSDKFTLIRCKSATFKPLPVAFKYSASSLDGNVADATKENDTDAERNVILVKKQHLNSLFYDKKNNSINQNNSNNYVDDFDKLKIKNCIHVLSQEGKDILKISKKLTAVQRNSSDSSKSSNFEDEPFYSCDEQELEILRATQEGGISKDVQSPLTKSLNIASNKEYNRKSCPPLLTSRVAVKISERTNNYKNRRAAATAAGIATTTNITVTTIAASTSIITSVPTSSLLPITTKNTKKCKALPANSHCDGDKSKQVENNKQLSVERLNSASIVRQQSDRRPDATGNNALGSNDNTAAHRNNDSLQSSFCGSSMVGVVELSGAGGPTDASSLLTSTGAQTGAGGFVGNYVATQDTAGKDGRKERLQHQQQSKLACVSVNRSESYKERLSHKRNRKSRRKTSDPSLTSRPNEEQSDVGLSNPNYPASSNSSLSSGGGSDSPSTSMEQVGGTGATSTQQHHTSSTAVHGHHAPQHIHQHSHQDSFHGSIGGSSSNTSFWSGSIGGASGQVTRQWNFESDEDDDLNEADWSSNVPVDILAALTDAEKKRQEIINEIYQTERSHVRTLKLLDRIFFCPLQDSSVLSPDHLMLLFPPALLSLRDMHSAFEQTLKQRRIEHNYIVNHIGDLLASMFDGQSGDDLCEFAAQFCARQQIALEALKEKRRKDEQLQKFLSKAESHKACRRLQLKDLLPTVLQRLTKYPLLFENLYKVTVRVVPENTVEAEAIQRALESSKKILVDVNQAVKTAEDAHKLQNIQRKLDKSNFDKDEFKNLDLTQYRLIHDGSLTMKKNPSIQLHGLLFDNMIVLLTKQDDKYSLKYLHAARNTEVNNKPVSPIMNIDSETLVRQEAADKNSFFLIKTKTSQMLELRAPSSTECKTWFKHISDAAEQYKPRSKNINHEPIDDQAIATLPHSNTTESLDLAPEQPLISATATIINTPLAPLMPVPSASVSSGSHMLININTDTDNNIQLRNMRRESTPTPGHASMTAYNKQQCLSHNEIIEPPPPSAQPGSSSALSVNRTMSTRSYGGETSKNNSRLSDGVTLRHTQSARQASAGRGGSESSDDIIGDSNAAGTALLAEGLSKHGSASIIYSNNSNNTRTLMQSSPPLVEPTAIQISISPAHIAEPVLTPAERLRRLDAAIRDGLLEKQKIICDIFRLPVEHFHEIVDIAAMPEAPKDSADIALAAYAQVQSLTEVLNAYMHVTPEHEISAVSTAVCDKCHVKQQRQQQKHLKNMDDMDIKSSVATVTVIAKKMQSAQLQQEIPVPVLTSLQAATSALVEMTDIHEDDDGYCEIDALRLPALPPLNSTTAITIKSQSSSPPLLPPPSGNFKAPPVASAEDNSSSSGTNCIHICDGDAVATELVKRQSTISADSIPEESADEVSKAMGDEVKAHQYGCDTNQQMEVKGGTASQSSDMESYDVDIEKNNDDNTNESVNNSNDPREVKHRSSSNKIVNEHIEINDTDDILSNLNKSLMKPMVDNSTQTQLAMTAMKTTTTFMKNKGLSTTNVNGSSDQPSHYMPLCGSNRMQHAITLEPSVPCHTLNGIVSVLNAQISLLLPKINERDMERERLRKENQHLRELLNAMHERQRVEAKLETPMTIDSMLISTATVKDAGGDDDDNNDKIVGVNNPSSNNSILTTTTITTETTEAVSAAPAVTTEFNTLATSTELATPRTPITPTSAQTEHQHDKQLL